MYTYVYVYRGGSRIFEGEGGQIRSTSKRGGGPDGGPILGPMLKSLHRGTKWGGGVLTPWTPPLDPQLVYMCVGPMYMTLYRGGSRIFERGGPGADTGFFTSTHPLDIVRVTSSALRKIEKHPHS